MILDCQLNNYPLTKLNKPDLKNQRVDSFNKSRVNFKGMSSELRRDLQKIEFRQGKIGDCVVLSMFHLFTRKGMHFLNNIIIDADKFKFPTVPIKISADRTIPVIRNIQASSNNSLLDDLLKNFEVAYYKLKSIQEVKGIHDRENVFNVLKQGTSATKVFKNFTGLLGQGVYETKKENMKLLLNKAKENPEKYFLAAAIEKNTNSKNGFFDHHSYAITEIKDDLITLINPHDTTKPITISWDTFFDTFDNIEGGVLNTIEKREKPFKFIPLKQKPDDTLQERRKSIEIYKKIEELGLEDFILKSDNEGKIFFIKNCGYLDETYVNNNAVRWFSRLAENGNNEVKKALVFGLIFLSDENKVKCFPILVTNADNKIKTTLISSLISVLPEKNWVEWFKKLAKNADKEVKEALHQLLNILPEKNRAECEKLIA